MPERRRLLGARHGDLHDPRRHLHAPLRLLQRQDRQADLQRPARAAARRALGGEDGPPARRRHQRRPRRPARLRRPGVGRRDPLDPHAGAVVQDRVPDARLPRRGDAAGEGDRRAPRRLQPQRRGRAAAVPGRPPRLALGALAARPAQRAGDGRRRGHDQVRPDGRPRRDARGDGRRLRAAARAGRAGAHRRPVPAADRAPPAGRALLGAGGVHRARARRLRARLRARRGRTARALLVPRRRARQAGAAGRRARRRRQAECSRSGTTSRPSTSRSSPSC